MSVCGVVLYAISSSGSLLAHRFPVHCLSFSLIFYLSLSLALSLYYRLMRDSRMHFSLHLRVHLFLTQLWAQSYSITWHKKNTKIAVMFFFCPSFFLCHCGTILRLFNAFPNTKQVIFFPDMLLDRLLFTNCGQICLYFRVNLKWKGNSKGSFLILQQYMHGIT